MSVRRSSLAGWLLLAGLLALITLRDSPGAGLYRTREATAPYAFNLLDWQIEQVAGRLGQIVGALHGEQETPSEADAETIRSYFRLPAAVRATMRPEVEAAIERLVAGALADEGLTAPSPLAGAEPIVFPPVSFTFTEPPQVLIVSPRDRIAVAQYVLLRTSLRPDEATLIEDGVASRGLSTLVTSIGGLSSYPAMVLGGRSAESTIGSVAHEWTHAFFFFHPLGRGYWSDQDARTINETAAELVGTELGNRLARQLGLPAGSTSAPPDPRQVEFRQLMRETRLEVDRLLGLGQVDQAEQYMEQRRLEINARGFAIRRLNQAYFAFFGSYAESPAGSSPIAGQVRLLRDRSPSLGAFIRTIAEISEPRQLERAVEGS